MKGHGMSNIIQASVTIQGTRPMLWHHFGPAAIPLAKQEKSGVAGNDPNEWRKTVLFDEKTRQLYILPSYIFGCLRDAAKHTPRKRGTLMSYVAATLQVLDTRVWVDRYLPPEPLPTDPDEPTYLDIQSARNPSTRARNVRYRVAASTGWRCSFTIEWDKTIVSREEMEAVLLDAGRLAGLGDGRAIGYGRFAVEDISLSNDAS
jgi:hypothetical protein